jgi:hypothetical protein
VHFVSKEREFEGLHQNKQVAISLGKQIKKKETREKDREREGGKRKR